MRQPPERARLRASALHALVVGLLVLAAGCRAEGPPGPAGPLGMDPYAKDLIDAGAKLLGVLTVLGGLTAVWIQFHGLKENQRKTLMEQELANERRREELLWRKASLARDVLGELLADPKAGIAMLILDWPGGREYEVDGEEVMIDASDMVEALRITRLKFDDTEVLVRDSFDAFFGHLQMIEHYVQIGLLEARDVAYPTSYYAWRMRDNIKVFDTYLAEYGFDKAQAFLRRREVAPGTRG